MSEDFGFIDMGMSFNDAENAVKSPIWPEKVYNFRIARVSNVTKPGGRPRALFMCAPLDTPDLANETLAFSVGFPWVDPEKGPVNNDFPVKQFISLCKGTGYTWQGTTPNPTDMVGREFRAEVKTGKDQNGDPQSEIKKIFPKA